MQGKHFPSQEIDKLDSKNKTRYYYNQLSFENATEEDSGTYTCIVRNHAGLENNETIAINVLKCRERESGFVAFG